MEQSNINFKNLIWYGLKKWRIIFVFAIFIGVCFGVYRYASLSGVITSETVTEDENYYTNLQTYVTEKINLESSIESYEAEIAELEEYTSSSIYANLDASEVVKTLATIYIDAKYQVENEVITQANNPLYTILYLYQKEVVYSDMYVQINEELNLATDEQYLNEIISVSYNADMGLLTLTIVSNDQEFNETIMDIALSYIYDSYDYINENIQEHTLVLCEAGSYVVSDSTIEAYGESIYSELTTAQNSLLTSQTLLSLLVEPEQYTVSIDVSESISTSAKIIQTIIWCIIGFIAGVFLMMCYFVVIPIMSNKILSETNLINAYGLTILGTKPDFPGKCFVDKLIFKLSNNTPIRTKEDFYDLLSLNIGLSFDNAKQIHMMGSVDMEILEEIHSNLSEDVKAKITVGGNINSSKKSLEDLVKADQVILVESLLKSNNEVLSKEVITAKNLNKEIKNIIVL